MKLKTILTVSAMALAMHAVNVMAKVPAVEAAKLGGSLTPVGGEKAGNADGSIPAWDGGLTKPPAFDGRNYKNPFPSEQPLLVITAANAAQHKDKLTPGQMALLAKYPTFKIRVFPTHRTAIFPDFVNESAKRNATVTELAAGGNGTTPYEHSFPFPILSGSDSDKAIQILWNHTTRWRGGTLERTITQVTPLANGEFAPVKFFEQLSFAGSLTDAEEVLKKDANVMFYFKQEIVSPARLAGNVLLAHETLDQVKEPRRAWVYNEGQRRVRRAPQVAYDGPGTASDGLRTTDNFDMWNGSPDRYDWKLVGKREMYIPYNNYDLMSTSLKYADVVKPGHLNSDLIRYELHRVLVVEANLKPGQRHIYAKRVFYVDEDTWQMAVVDHYDGRGDLWRVAEGYATLFYDVKTPFYAANAVYDLLSGRYIAMELTNEEEKGYVFGIPASSTNFTPSALRRSGRK
jgi:hypothetical protein